MKKAIIILIIGMFLFSGCYYDTIVESKDNTTVKINTDNTSLDVNIQDYTGPLESFYLINVLDVNTFTNNISIGNNEIGSTDTKFCVIGDVINIYNGYDLFQAKITSLNSTHYKFTPVIDKVFAASDSYYECGPTDMSVLGTITNPVIYSIHPPEKVNWQIKTNIVNFIDNSPMDGSMFGSQSALTNGFLIRRKDGIYENLFMIYNNNGFTNRGYKFVSIPKAPSGSYTSTFNLQFNDIYGTIIQLNGSSNDMFQNVIYDDLRSQERIVSAIGGHTTTE